jgi:L-galactono-1,4-lactone dehydrogenase
MSAFLRSFAVFWSRHYRQYLSSSSYASFRGRAARNSSDFTLPFFMSMIPSMLLHENTNTTSQCEQVDVSCGVAYENSQSFMNWSSTHECHPARVYSPRSTQEVSRILRLHHDMGKKVRPIGTALSPNGIGFVAESDSLISLSSIDHIQVDVKRQLVTVGAGATVKQVLHELQKHGLTLQNFSSIQEQQIGGWMQVSAHGTGCKLSTVDDMILRLTLAVPTGGILPLSEDNYPFLFHLAKVGLGSLGVVTELTLKCIPQMNLEEKTVVVEQASLSIAEHMERLESYRHVRYMWIPYTDNIVAVVSNPTSDRKKSESMNGSEKLATRPLIDLLLQIEPKRKLAEAKKLSFSQFRDILLDADPLNLEHIKRVNAAEAMFWKNSQGSRVDDSTNILGFDCGGEQLVLEACFPIGSLKDASGRDLEFVKKLLKAISDAGIPAPSPIEQRWSARSRAPMSPAYSSNSDEIFSWVGIIMYLPPNQSEEQRQMITKRFEDYSRILYPLIEEYKGQVHWAKIEASSDANDLDRSRKLIRAKYPVKDFNRLRKILDPKHIMSNELITKLFDD